MQQNLVAKKNNANSTGSYWNGSRTSMQYPHKLDNSDPIFAYSRLALWCYCFGFSLSPTMSLFETEQLRAHYLENQLFWIPLSLLIAVFLSGLGKKIYILLGNFTLHIGGFLSYFTLLPTIAESGVEPNFFLFLPLMALSNLALLFLWSEYPKSIFVFIILYAIAIISSTAIFLSLRQNQLGAFCIFFAINFCLFLFQIVFRQMALRMQSSMMQAHTARAEAQTSDRMLNLAVEVNFPALICFDAAGKLIASRGEIAHQFLPAPDNEETPLTLVEVLLHFKQKFNVDLSIRNDSRQQICLNDRHFLISRRDASDIVAFAFIDITERIKQDERLNKSQKMGMIGEITSGIAHDYNNLLAIMLANLEAIPKEDRDKLWTPYLATTYKSIDQAKIISAKLLTIAGKREVMLKPVLVGQVVEDIAPLLHTAVGDEITLSVKIENGLYVAADANELGSAILNLVVNARNAITRNDGKISVRVYRQDKKAIIEVIDNGKGISAKNISKIFDPFYTTKNRQNSTGLGLSLVQTFVKQCGGDIQLQSRYGKTRFQLRFPITAPPVELTISETDAENRKKFTRKERILLVDDNVDLVHSMQRLLTCKGYECTAKSSPAEGIEAVIKSSDFTTVILDLSMPDQNGIEVSKFIKPLLPKAKFILLTGDIDSENEVKAYEAGFHAVLMKPIKITDLIETINALSRQKATPPKLAIAGRA